MKKKLYKEIYCFLLFSTMVSLVLLSGCKDDEDDMGPAVVTEIRNYAASPNDTVIQTLYDGQWVVLMGKNLNGVSQVFFGGIQATINQTLCSDQSIVVEVPAIPFQTTSSDKLHEITLVKNGVTTTYNINISGTPIISRVR